MIVIVPEGDGTLCFSVDYRKKNRITIWDSYLKWDMNDSVDSLLNATIVQTLDANRPYWNVGIAEDDLGKTSFKFHHGLIIVLTCPLALGLKSAQGPFKERWKLYKRH